MKRHVLSAFLLMALFLSACNGNNDTPETTSISGIYTSAALTVAAAPDPAVSTPTLIDISTPMPTSMTFISIGTTPTATTYSYSTVTSCNSSAYVSDVTISDGTEFAPGATFTKTWKFANTGSCTWSSSYSIAFVSGNDMDGSDTEIDQSVSSGSTAEISVDLTAPEDVGTYTGYWSLADESGTIFGQKVFVQIVVSDNVTTNTPTSTLTSTATSADNTSTPTSVPPTNTPLPTDIPTSTPEVPPPTDTPGS
jgi:hypothetical protein